MAMLDTIGAFDALSPRPTTVVAPQLEVVNGHVVLAFDDTVNEGVDFLGVLPASYAGGGIEVLVRWAASSGTSGSIRWEAAFERHPINDPTYGTLDLSTDGFDQPVHADGLVPSSAAILTETMILLTATQASNPQAGESFRLRLTRSATSPEDTLPGDAHFLTLHLKEQ